MSQKHTTPSGQRALARVEIARARKHLRKAKTHLANITPPWEDQPIHAQLAADSCETALAFAGSAEAWLDTIAAIEGN